MKTIYTAFDPQQVITASGAVATNKGYFSGYNYTWYPAVASDTVHTTAIDCSRGFSFEYQTGTSAGYFPRVGLSETNTTSANSLTSGEKALTINWDGAVYVDGIQAGTIALAGSDSSDRIHIDFNTVESTAHVYVKGEPALVVEVPSLAGKQLAYIHAMCRSTSSAYSIKLFTGHPAYSSSFQLRYPIGNGSEGSPYRQQDESAIYSCHIEPDWYGAGSMAIEHLPPTVIHEQARTYFHTPIGQSLYGTSLPDVPPRRFHSTLFSGEMALGRMRHDRRFKQRFTGRHYEQKSRMPNSTPKEHWSQS